MCIGSDRGSCLGVLNRYMYVICRGLLRVHVCVTRRGLAIESVGEHFFQRVSCNGARGGTSQAVAATNTVVDQTLRRLHYRDLREFNGR
jgi:hypothetical protein